VAKTITTPLSASSLDHDISPIDALSDERSAEIPSCRVFYRVKFCEGLFYLANDTLQTCRPDQNALCDTRRRICQITSIHFIGLPQNSLDPETRLSYFDSRSLPNSYTNSGALVVDQQCLHLHFAASHLLASYRVFGFDGFKSIDHRRSRGLCFALLCMHGCFECWASFDFRSSPAWQALLFLS
jgi:hypothetical protein